ncbi:MAG: polyprenyl synthetase family protein [Bacillota bacterium]
MQQLVETAGPEITSVGSYVFNGSGKRMRPTLFLLAAYHGKNRLSYYVEAAVALELIHTASLLHDDVIDQAPTRRKKETVHVKWNNKISILTGDYLLSQAFKILVGYRDWSLVDTAVEMVQSMTEGEIEQTFATTDSSALEERYFHWIGKKSASFFAGCCRAGKLLSGGDFEEQASWEEFGYNLGMAFQLIDDLLDYTGKGEMTGKPVYGDLHNRVITLPLIRTIKHTREIDEEIQNLLQHEANSNHLSEMVQAVLNSDGPAYTYRKAQEYIARAEIAINKIPGLDGKVKDVLNGLTVEVLNRKQ